MPKVSVVIPTYNRGKLVVDAIQSVLAQTFRDFEIIVVDSSTDNTAELVSAFPVRYFWQEKQGISAARNKGIELACGEYIAFLDADDILMKNTLEKGVEVLDRYPEAAFSYGQTYHADERGRIRELLKGHSKYTCVREGRKEIADVLAFGDRITTSTVMVRRSCLEEVGVFNPAFVFGYEDTDLWLRLAKRYAVAYIAEPLVIFRYNSMGSSTHSFPVKEWERSKIAVLESIFNDAELGALFIHLRPIAFFRCYLWLAGQSYERREIKTAREYLLKAIKTYPMILFKGFGLTWMISFAKTWMPHRVLIMARRPKRYLNMVIWRIFHRFQTMDKEDSYA